MAKRTLAEITEATKMMPDDDKKRKALPKTPPAYETGDEHTDRLALQKLSKDLRAGAAAVKRSGARLILDMFYQQQETRETYANYVRAAEANGEPSEFFQLKLGNAWAEENQNRLALESFAGRYKVGNWITSIHGLGPITAAGMLSFIDIRRADYVGKIWKFGGMAGETIWRSKAEAEKFVTELMGGKKRVTTEHIAACAEYADRKLGNFQRSFDQMRKKGSVKQVDALVKATCMRPYNKKFKTFCLGRIAGSLIKTKDGDGPDKVNFYGHAYRAHKAWIEEQNKASVYEKDALALQSSVGKSTKAYQFYKDGYLPPGHVDRRAQRFMMKLLLSHVHCALFEDFYGETAPLPWILAKDDNHNQYIAPPNWPIADDMPGEPLSVLYEGSDPVPEGEGR